MKIKPTFPVIEYIGSCVKCGETHLAEKFGDAIINGESVCAFCQRNPRTTERSEGVSPTERSEGGSERG